MRILIVTEKAGKNPHWLDGGASLLSTMKCQDASWDVMQFGDMNSHMADKVFAYPHQTANRFQRRIKNAPFVATKVCEAAPGYDCIIFVHVAMLFGISRVNLPARIRLICMPMFLTPSYVLGGEDAPLSALCCHELLSHLNRYSEDELQWQRNRCLHEGLSARPLRRVCKCPVNFRGSFLPHD